MKIPTRTVSEILSRLREYFQAADTVRDFGMEEALRSELFDSEQLISHGKAVARSHALSERRPANQLLERLEDNDKTLLEVRSLLVESIQSGKAVSPGAEWLLDNFYLIEEQVVIARKHLPKGYSLELPHLAGGPSSGLPRVYDIALEIISHSDGRVDVKNLGGFISAYQSLTPLTLGEIWAIPIMLRLTLLENLRRVSGKMALDMIDRNLADYWSDRMATILKEDPADLILTVSDMARSNPVLTGAFVAGIIRKLQGKGPALALTLGWMEPRLSGAGTGSEELIRRENRKQAADQASIRNSIGTLRFLGATDWRDFVEASSLVEQVLRQDASGEYPRMDFATRDRYRHAVESMSKAGPLTEMEVARKVLGLAAGPWAPGGDPGRRGHVGFYLIGEGRSQAELGIGVRYGWRRRAELKAGRMPVFLYLSGITALTAAATLLMGAMARGQGHGIQDPLHLSLVGMLSALGASQLAVSLVNWLSTLWVRPELLPRMDFSKGIPPEFRTLVVVPTMLSSRPDIDDLVEALEIRFLSNRQSNLHFALLTDYLDADAETMPVDGDLLNAAKEGIEGLNRKYGEPGVDTFFLLNRSRIWNPREAKWMGHERKRGKLAGLNALILGRGQNGFTSVVGDLRILSTVRYVLTLDSDTGLPRESAWKIVATMAHPLNKAVFDARKGRVTEGYGILQPRIVSTLAKSSASPYLRMQGDVSGVDPYTRVSSDVYQDLFGEGSFIGKGIYDVEVFERTLSGVFPENRILSHDLLEGCYARCGLISDVHLYEEGPGQYGMDAKRRHRWIRGDWQIGAWILPFPVGGTGRSGANRLSALSRWKIFDNLRRSLIPLSLLLLLLAGWTILPLPWFWTLSVLAILILPATLALSWQLIRKPPDLTIKAHLSEAGGSAGNALLRVLFEVAVLPYEAWKHTDAVARTLWRMAVSRKRLLEWTSSAAVSRNARGGLGSVWWEMRITTLAALACLAFLPRVNPEALAVAAPILLLWLSAPLFAWLLGLPETGKEPRLPEDQILFLNRTARRTWSYFERFVNASENWLPPDNFQEHPTQVIAHRTSPTNMGLTLLANLSAFDFGYITGRELARRCGNTLQSMLKLERFQGHFLNWYDTETMLPLPPRYVSTVDSGNLLGHLLTLRQGLLAQPGLPLFTGRIYEGLATTVRILREFSEGPHAEAVDSLLAILDAAAKDVGGLSAVKKRFGEIEAIAGPLAALTDAGSEQRRWTEAVTRQITDIRENLMECAPWLKYLPAPERFPELAALDAIPSLSDLAGLKGAMLAALDWLEQREMEPEERAWSAGLRACLVGGAEAAAERIGRLEELADHCEQLSTVEYGFLFDESTDLLSIGFNVEDRRKDPGSYDLLASEARLGIFVGIAQGKLPQQSWFALGRLLTHPGRFPVLLSWSGSMFEYLMPQLVMPDYENTLLSQTGKATVRRQVEYAAQRGIPWGISESAYNRVDASLNYQYRAFGVPGLGLKRGLEADLVVAPYATLLALMVSPAQACANLQTLSGEGFEGDHGFFEAIDYTAGRLPRGRTHTVVKSYMVHHQGMSLLSLAYTLLDRPMQARFVSDLRFKAALPLLQERIPRATRFYAHTSDATELQIAPPDVQARRITSIDSALPEIQLLSNGRYHVMITHSGGGYSRWKDLAVTRWREDATKDDRGIFCYIKDVADGGFWSNTHQPTLVRPEAYEAVFSQGHAGFRRRDQGFDTETEIVISPEDDVEMRRVRITNRTRSERILEVTSYAEIVLASHASDEAHPAFSNLFVQTEIAHEHQAVYCTRRKRSEEEVPPWMFHHMDIHGVRVDAVSYETDRMRFIGRGRTLARPRAMDGGELSGSQGSVLDPVVSIRFRIALKPGQTATVDLILGIGESREACEGLARKYRDKHFKSRAVELSWTHSQVRLRQINATEADAQLYDRLAASILFPNPGLRAEAGVIGGNFRGQSGLWSHSVSGDLPIVLLHVRDPESMELVRQLVQAHAYWRLKGLAVDLVIWNEDHGSYRQALQERILGLITRETGDHPTHARAGTIFVKTVELLSSEDRVLFESVARIIIDDRKGTLAEQAEPKAPGRSLPLQLVAKLPPGIENHQAMALPEGLLFSNGIGGFTPDGREYKMMTSEWRPTPAPWVNVIANPEFGTVVSESGSAYTWAANAHEYRLTPWSNDPVSDGGGEAFYIRDEETARFWSPSPFPAMGKTPYLTTHGFGYSVFEHTSNGIASEMRVFVDRESPVKFIAVKIRNLSGRGRRLSITGFMEAILGDVRSRTHMHVISERDAETGGLLLRNRYNPAFSDRVAFFAVDAIEPGFTADRAEFIGRNRNLQDPQAMRRKGLSRAVGAGLDPCAALQANVELLDGEETEVVFRLGSGENTQAAVALLRKFSGRDAMRRSWSGALDFWRENLGALQVETPDASLNLLANGWLTYQTLACRLFARSGFYQSGGAFGFRDQLQDVLALLPIRPDLARKQILLSASRQFVEGDVQHWWHPPEGRGVRTRCSDDLLWLPFAVSRYVEATGDAGILDMPVGYLEGPALNPEEDSRYDLPFVGNLSGTLYEHCVRAIARGQRLGEHGLPLIGSGDWNDGMDRVGSRGRGESVWLAFFLHDVLRRFSEVAKGHGDPRVAAECRKDAAALQADIESHAWDGQWYLRAFFDDGSKLGSHENAECRIDAIAQSWSVLSGAAGPTRRVTAMASLDQYLVRRDLKLIQLLDPPFDADGPNPGYIRGYVPGVRENGGQYSHAAVWSLMAFAALGDREKVWELFSMVNPVRHASDFAAAQVYKVEPYVMAADVYANPSHQGRGGWTWYTGSSGWMHQFLIGSLLGMELKAGRLVFTPCFPLAWPSVSIAYRFGKSLHRITVFQSDSIARSWWKSGDGQGDGNAIDLLDDGLEHGYEIHCRIARLPAPQSPEGRSSPN